MKHPHFSFWANTVTHGYFSSFSQIISNHLLCSGDGRAFIPTWRGFTLRVGRSKESRHLHCLIVFLQVRSQKFTKWKLFSLKLCGTHWNNGMCGDCCWKISWTETSPANCVIKKQCEHFLQRNRSERHLSRTNGQNTSSWCGVFRYHPSYLTC